MSSQPGVLIRAKHVQAARLMREHELDCWFIQFVRETTLRPDPMDFLVGMAVTWPAAFLLRADGRSVAIVGAGDRSQAEAVGAWNDVLDYRDSIRGGLLHVLDRWSPERIGVSWHEGDPLADGITHGMMLTLEQLLKGTRHRHRLVSAGRLAAEVRSRKLPAEIAGIERAVAATESIFERITESLHPGLTELALQRLVQRWIREARWGFAWDEAMNPIVDFGLRQGSVVHTLARRAPLEPGHVAHVDLGVRVDGFVSDLQRCWYWRRAGEAQAPASVQRAFDVCVEAVDALVGTLVPGTPGYEVDAAARAVILANGYPDPGFAFGHHIGRSPHDGGGVLGPRWPRYGDMPLVPVREGNVLALEAHIPVDSHGLIATEDNVVIEAARVRWLSQRQLSLIELGP